MYYPCQPWDSSLGIATSLLHRLGIGEDGRDSDPYEVLESLPLKPGARIDLDAYRRRLNAHLQDDSGKLGTKPPQLLLILDDVHNIGTEGNHLFGALLQVAEATSLRLLMISRTNLAFYDRRDVHTREKVRELSLTGLTIEEVREWISSLEVPRSAPIDEIHKATGGHPLAVCLLYTSPSPRD